MSRVLLNFICVWLAFVVAFFTPMLAGLSWEAVCVDMIAASAATIVVAAALMNCRHLSANGKIEPFTARLLISSRWLLVAWGGLVFLGLLGGHILGWALGVELQLRTKVALELPATFAATALALVSFAVKEGQSQSSAAAV